MRAAILALALIVASVAIPSMSSAAITTYGTRIDWEGAVGAFDTEDFESTPVQLATCTDYLEFYGCQHEIVIDASKLDIIIPVGDHAAGYDGIFGNGAVDGTHEFHADLHAGVLIEGVSYNTIAFPQPILAIAIDLANVFDYDVYCNVDCGPVPFPLTVSIDGEDFALPFGADFFGASSNVSFSSLVIRATDPMQGEYVIPSLDNIGFVAVPEPSAGALTALGFLLLAGGSRFARRPTRTCS